MKRIYIIILLLSILGLFSCKQGDYLLYDSGQQNRLTFLQDTMRFTYGLTLDRDTDLVVSVRLMGLVNKMESIPFKVSVNKENTNAEEGTHFVLPEETLLHKDSASASIAIDFRKEKLEFDKDYKLTLDLVTNSNFQSDDIKHCVIVFGNKSIPAPVWWRTDRLGEYNQDKYILFVSYFAKTKDISAVLYNNIVRTWGENLDKSKETNLLTIYRYQGFLQKYILRPMYAQYLETNDQRFKIPNPN